MIALFLLTAMGEQAETPAPEVVSAVQINLGGACNFPGGGLAVAAQIGVQWSITNPDDTNYEVRVYRDGSFRAAYDTTDTEHLETVAGVVEDGVVGADTYQFTGSWTFRVDVVRKSDSVVVSTKSTTPTPIDYYTCA